MKESGKKREWVKTAAIIFLSVMLVLTFFSNTIMNYSLPEVATQYVMNGTITAKIRGTGVIESGDPYNVEVTYSRKVASVAVREGDKVEKGDVLIYLEDEESEELKSALAVLKDAQKAYDNALLNIELTSTDIKDANNGMTVEDFRKKISNYQYLIKTEENKISPLKDKLSPLETQKADITQRISDIDTQLGYESSNDSAALDRVDVTQKAKDYAAEDMNTKRAALDSAVASKNSIAAQLEEARRNSASDGNAAAQVPVLEAQLNAANDNVTAKQTAYNDAATAYNTALANYNSAVENMQDRNTSTVHANLSEQKASSQVELYNVEKQIKEIQDEIDAAEAKKAEYEAELVELQERMGNVLGLSELLGALEAAQAEVDKLNAKSYDATITAPISGTISTLNVTAGEHTTAAVPVAVMQPEGKGYTMSFTVTNEQAKKLSVGDRADLINAWRYDDVVATLSSIKVDKNNPAQQKVLTFDVTGSVVAGQSLTVSVGQKSANYDYIVPNSAIREDNNGQFILIVESKPSPLGTRYTASRVDVQVIASDDTQSAITGGIMGYEFVITTSTKPVQAGELVRLAD